MLRASLTTISVHIHRNERGSYFGNRDLSLGRPNETREELLNCSQWAIIVSGPFIGLHELACICWQQIEVTSILAKFFLACCYVFQQHRRDTLRSSLVPRLLTCFVSCTQASLVISEPPLNAEKTFGMRLTLNSL